MGRLTARSNDVSRTIEPGETLHFGRAAASDLVLGHDPLDSGISRNAGELTWIGDRWWLLNRSSTRSFDVVDVTRWPKTIAPKGATAIDDAQTLVIVTGAVLRHGIRIEVEGPLPASDEPLLALDGEATTRVIPTTRERRALAALCEGFLLEWPYYRSVPASYEEAAKRTGLDASTVRKRVERFRDRIVDTVGVELAGGDYRLAICRFVLTHRLIAPSDLPLLDELE